MRLAQNSNRYHPAAIFLHWLMFVLLITMYLIIQIRDYLPTEDTMRTSLILLHKSLGVSFLALVICRLVVKSITIRPAITPPLSSLIDRTAWLGHAALYVVMLIMPVSGYMMSVASGHPVAFFGMSLPTLISPDKVLSETMYNTHGLIAQIILVLVGIHILTALWHHFIRGDNTLIRMMPKKSASK